MSNILGGLLLLMFWLGSARIGAILARMLKAPYWSARLLAQLIGGVTVGVLFICVAGQVSGEVLVVAAVIAAIHASVIKWLMRDTPSDWPES